MLATLLMLAQFTSFNSERGVNILEGNWQSCIQHDDGEYQEEVYDHPAPPAFEFHMGPRDQFALFKGVHGEHDRSHDGSENLLGRDYKEITHNWRDARNWTIGAGLNLYISVVLAGGSRSECESYFVLIRKVR